MWREREGFGGAENGNSRINIAPKRNATDLAFGDATWGYRSTSTSYIFRKKRAKFASRIVCICLNNNSNNNTNNNNKCIEDNTKAAARQFQTALGKQ